ncbi:MAG: Txe/YoeB family addiction module toxin [Bacteroidales bacterium]|nr:Txe/YoeB family addiction module toxin [Bacteroidales bacterium]
MRLVIDNKAQEDLRFWYDSGQRQRKKIEDLIKDIMEHPTWGIGKPEQLRHDLTGRWSRRIDRKNRIVYRVSDDNTTVFILSLRGHYEK